MKTIYISCPANSYTGGPTLAHQLCRILSDNGINSKMLYYGRAARVKNQETVHPNYVCYRNDYVTGIPDSEDAVIVALETIPEFLAKYSYATRVIWWMSVDNYFMSMGSLIEKVLRKQKLFSPSLNYQKKIASKKKYQIIKDKDIIHLVQSEYAREFLKTQGIDDNRIYYLSDYLEDSLMNDRDDLLQKPENKVVLYNPKKGLEVTEKIISMTKELKWVPLVNMTKSQMMDCFASSKLYIDFGNHPGKDRIPREAAISGCCVITGRNGSAKNPKDICIPEGYKFDDTDNELPNICAKIRYVIDNYETCCDDFAHYRDVILGEKERFIQDAISVFSKLI